jgi:hypothetical protein
MTRLEELACHNEDFSEELGSHIDEDDFLSTQE